MVGFNGDESHGTIRKETYNIQTRYLNPQTSPEQAFRGSKHLLTRCLEDFGCIGKPQKQKLSNVQHAPPQNGSLTSCGQHCSY